MYLCLDWPNDFFHTFWIVVSAFQLASVFALININIAPAVLAEFLWLELHEEWTKQIISIRNLFLKLNVPCFICCQSATVQYCTFHPIRLNFHWSEIFSTAGSGADWRLFEPRSEIYPGPPYLWICNCSMQLLMFYLLIYNRKLVKFTKVETRDYDTHNVGTNICLNIKNEINYCSLYIHY